MVFYTGVAGAAISIVGCAIANYGGLGDVDSAIQEQRLEGDEGEDEGSLVIESMETLDWPGWAALLALRYT